MKIIDFDAPFHEALSRWMKEMAARHTPEEMEARVGDVYMRFNNTEADWLGGLTPAQYFHQFDDPAELVRALDEYEHAGVSTPELLLGRIVELGERAVPALMEVARDEGECESLRVTALNLLIEIDTAQPMEDCFAIIDKGEESEVAEVASELLRGLGQMAVPGMLSRIDSANGAALMAYLDLLCNFPGDERIYTYTEREFLRDSEHRALYATLLGRLGDSRAVATLRRVMLSEDINYLDYLEIANAIEMLGEDAGERDREFSGDPYYEALRSAQ